MTDKGKPDFGKRRQVSVPPSQPRAPQPQGKRSNHVALLVMGTLAVGGTAYSLMPRECAPGQPGTMPTVTSPAECPPRSSSSGGHGGSSRYGFSSSSSGSTPSGTTTDAGSGGVKRGGFGSFASSFSSHFSVGT